jgi:hypothetical protein
MKQYFVPPGGAQFSAAPGSGLAQTGEPAFSRDAPSAEIAVQAEQDSLDHPEHKLDAVLRRFAAAQRRRLEERRAVAGLGPPQPPQ